MFTSPPLSGLRMRVSNKPQRATQSECHCRPVARNASACGWALSTGIARLPIRFLRIVIASASLTLNDHIGQPSPIDAYNEFGLTVPATENRRIKRVTLKCDRVVSRGLYEAPLWVAFDNAQKNSTLHGILPRNQYPRSRPSRHCLGRGRSPAERVSPAAGLRDLRSTNPFKNSTCQQHRSRGNATDDTPRASPCPVL